MNHEPGNLPNTKFNLRREGMIDFAYSHTSGVVFLLRFLLTDFLRSGYI